MLSMDALVSTLNNLSKFGNAKIGAIVTLCLRVSKLSY